jgi:HlyD family secretion protein
MNFASLKKIDRKIWITVGIILILVVAFVALRSQSKAASSTTYQTEPARRDRLTASIGATGTVHARQSAALTWQTNGRVESVSAAVGDAVAADEVLASLAQTSMSQNVILAEADLVSAQKSLDDLMVSNTSRATAEQNLAVAKQAADDAQDKVDSITFPRASDNLIQQTQARIDLAKKEVALAEDNYKRFKSKPDGDSSKADALLRLTNARQDLTNLTISYNWYTGKATELDAENYRAELAVAKAQLADAQREVDRLKNGPTEDDIAVAKARVAAAQGTLNQSRIIAPFDGIVTQAEPLVGDLVVPGAAAFRVEDLSHLYVDLEISEVDINSVAVDQPVSMVFDAVQGKTYNGKVVTVNQSGDVTAGTVNFVVTVELNDADKQVKPGMTAAVTITVKEIQNALLVPNRAVRVVDGNRIVYVLVNDQPVSTEIRLGAASDAYSEVIGGDLTEGDLIILNPPAVFGPPSGRPGGNGGGN